MALSGLITYESLCFNEINRRILVQFSRIDETHPSQMLKLPGERECVCINSGLTCHQFFQ